MSRLRTANLLGALAGEVANRLDRQLKTHPNQTNSSAAALNVIAYYEGCTNARLARALRLSHPAAVRLVDKLEAQGLAESRDAADGRAVSLYLTDAGKAQAHTVLEERCVTLSGLIGVLSREEQAQLAHCLEKLLANLIETPDHADYICRLCDDIACPPKQCPVHLAASHGGAGTER
jgi:MarR family transcriptional regulator, negative regulator of the multidrug operon emrRAB